MELPKNYETNATVLLFKKISKMIYLVCAKNFWFEETNLPRNLVKINNKISYVLEVVAVGFLVAQWGAFITQHNLTEKQSGDMTMYAFGHTVIYFVYVSVWYYRDRMRRLVFTLLGTLGACADAAVERAMINKIKWYSLALTMVCSSSLLFHGLGMCVQSLTTNATFVTVTPAWPDVEDRRHVAGAARVLFYLIWWIFMIRVVSTYFIIIAITICLSHQFAKLHNYFISLNAIFEGDHSQEEKEMRYEAAVKVGIKTHSTILWCVRETQVACGLAYVGQIVINVYVLVLLMIQMTRSERTLANMTVVVCLATSVLTATGIFMWNAGDITVEANRLPSALFQSGWHHCRGAANLRARKLITFAIAQAQKPVVIKVLGVVELSYQSYVSIVKSSYSLFSVIY